jgi:hypothetical protein
MLRCRSIDGRPPTFGAPAMNGARTWQRNRHRTPTGSPRSSAGFVGDLGATVAAGGVVIGHRLGLYRALADGPATPE